MSIQDEIIGFVAEVLEQDARSLKLSDHFVQDLAASSIDIMTLVMRIEQHYGLAETPDAAAVVAAAKKADAHEMILEFPEGYDTRINSGQQRLSGGQIQRIGLARALYADPVIMVLDEPNSNLDNDGTEALNRAIRAMKADGRSIMIMAHRPSAIEECEMLLILDQGMRVAFGPKDEVLRSNVQNHQQITQAPRRAGGIS